VLETALSETRGVTEAVAAQVASLKDTSKNVLGDVADLTLRFDEQARGLNAAATLLSDVNRNLETTVEERRRSLEELAGNLVDKTQSVETMMHAFSTLVGDTLTTAETRARDVGAALTTAAEEAMRKVLGQLDTMRQTAGTEGQRSAEALRAAQDAMIGEMTRAVGETTGRFAEATDKMREAARMMQTELETTRTELRRGVLELPKETEESTAQLRRVVTDQLKALADLSALVGRQTANLDVSRASGTRVASVEAAPRYEAPRRAQPAAEPVAAFPEPRRPAAAPQPTPPAYGTYREAAPAAPREEPAAAAPRGGWMSDLLRRASRDDEPAAPAYPRPSAGQVVDSLNSLSVDIARAIDDEAFEDLWDRYRQGERNVFTRRLYTLQGQQTFEEIRRKYQRDGEFRNAVDRYVVDFESLLGEASRSSRDPDAARNYLASDTGKVYTLLAHAAGRLD
jgi:hypothetical protein